MKKLCMGWGFGLLEFCFFLVVFPARCVSRVSARFLIYGAHAVCFLPLVLGILDPFPIFKFFFACTGNVISYVWQPLGLNAGPPTCSSVALPLKQSPQHCFALVILQVDSCAFCLWAILRLEFCQSESWIAGIIGLSPTYNYRDF
jgi:hypothetical protein